MRGDVHPWLVPVQDSAKGAVNVASSVQASFQSLKVHSVVVPLLL